EQETVTPDLVAYVLVLEQVVQHLLQRSMSKADAHLFFVIQQLVAVKAGEASLFSNGSQHLRDRDTVAGNGHRCLECSLAGLGVDCTRQQQDRAAEIEQLESPP